MRRSSSASSFQISRVILFLTILQLYSARSVSSLYLTIESCLKIRLDSLLSYLIQPKPAVVESPAVANGEKDHTSRISDAISNSILSIGDLFKDVRDSHKSVKFPERLLKVLEQRLQNIAMGKDATCVAMTLRFSRSLLAYSLPSDILISSSGELLPHSMVHQHRIASSDR